MFRVDFINSLRQARCLSHFFFQNRSGPDIGDSAGLDRLKAYPTFFFYVPCVLLRLRESLNEPNILIDLINPPLENILVILLSGQEAVVYHKILRRADFCAFLRRLRFQSLEKSDFIRDIRGLNIPTIGKHPAYFSKSWNAVASQYPSATLRVENDLYVLAVGITYEDQTQNK